MFPEFAVFRRIPDDFETSSGHEKFIAYFYIDEEVRRKKWDEFIDPVYVQVFFMSRQINKRFIVMCDDNNTISDVFKYIPDLIRIDDPDENHYNFVNPDTDERIGNINIKFRYMDDQSNFYNVLIQEH